MQVQTTVRVHNEYRLGGRNSAVSIVTGRSGARIWACKID